MIYCWEELSKRQMKYVGNWFPLQKTLWISPKVTNIDGIAICCCTSHKSSYIVSLTKDIWEYNPHCKKGPLSLPFSVDSSSPPPPSLSPISYNTYFILTERLIPLPSWQWKMSQESIQNTKSIIKLIILRYLFFLRLFCLFYSLIVSSLFICNPCHQNNVIILLIEGEESFAALVSENSNKYNECSGVIHNSAVNYHTFLYYLPNI